MGIDINRCTRLLLSALLLFSVGCAVIVQVHDKPKREEVKNEQRQAQEEEG